MLPAEASSAVSSANGAPSTSCTQPVAKLSMRIFGPARSASMPTLRPAVSAAARTSSTRRRCESRVPWEKLMRATSSPASIMPAITAGSSVAGPSVATILVRRAVSMADRSYSGARLQHGDRRQRLAFHEFQECAPARGNVGDAVFDAVFLDARQRIAATGEGVGAAAGDRIGDGARAFAELIELEHAHAAVPQHRTGRLDQRPEMLGRVGAQCP